MGTLIYGAPGIEIAFDDRTLAHLQVVITAKVRRGESFVFSWVTPVESGSGRNSIWLDPAIPLYFRYGGSRLPALNREWIDTLAASSNTAGGLVLTPEKPANP